MNVVSRRWCRFSLRTLVIVLPIAVAAGYWVVRFQTASLAKAHYDHMHDGWQAEAVSNEQLLAAEAQWTEAALAVPFANRRRICTARLDRLARYCQTLTCVYGATCGAIGRAELHYYVGRADRDYAKTLAQLRLLAGDEYADKLKAKHDRQLPRDWQSFGFTKLHDPTVVAWRPVGD